MNLSQFVTRAINQFKPRKIFINIRFLVIVLPEDHTVDALLVVRHRLEELAPLTPGAASGPHGDALLFYLGMKLFYEPHGGALLFFLGMKLF